ncbi:hypothetical protein C1J03_00245 [Sulfitobacter sp. SK012]|uniref:glycosyltransferase n=1 Tax=Sulfitobacter sp. SK012 TaxID=1389005 RepID=UPI000E0C7738|nr:glycosyltransferase [Sulfitobacter sp. SK012]AXI44594.1 hypothetical protein C1J03_00245 [Sulfitobacter sp. SK012]
MTVGTAQRDMFDLLVAGVSDDDRAALKQALDAGQTVEDVPLSDPTARLLAFYAGKSTDGLDDALSAKVLTKASLRKLPDLSVEDHITSTKKAIKLAFELTLNRRPKTKELNRWTNEIAGGTPFPHFLLALNKKADSQSSRTTAKVAPNQTDAEFVQFVYRIIEGRGGLPSELEHFRELLQGREMSRADQVINFFNAEITRLSKDSVEVLHDGLSSWIMGTNRIVHLDNWAAQAKDTEALAAARAALKPATPYHINPDSGLRVSAITSLFRGGDFIEQFMDNITTQTCFDRHSELIIIDADSPENEGEVIARYLKDHPNIQYRRMDSCIGIYEAWNLGVQMSKGDYLTNANLDDLRRADSFEIQAGALDATPFADVVYQDFYYSFAPNLSWDEVAAFGYKSDLPVITPYNMLRFNSPHNAPMWRKSLHSEMGLFDASYKSAGDYEFWMRCLSKGKSFFKVNEPHVVYYQNPKGLSTRADTRGLIEGRMILKKYAAQLIAQGFTADLPEFTTDILGLPKSSTQDEVDRSRLVQKALRDLARAAKPEMGTGS